MVKFPIPLQTFHSKEASDNGAKVLTNVYQAILEYRTIAP